MDKIKNNPRYIIRKAYNTIYYILNNYNELRRVSYKKKKIYCRDIKLYNYNYKSYIVFYTGCYKFHIFF